MKSVLKIVPFLFLAGCTLLEDPDEEIQTNQIVGHWQRVAQEQTINTRAVETVDYILDISEIEVAIYNNQSKDYKNGTQLPDRYEYTLSKNELAFGSRSFHISFSEDTLVLEETTPSIATIMKAVDKYLPYTGELPPTEWFSDAP